MLSHNIKCCQISKQNCIHKEGRHRIHYLPRNASEITSLVNYTKVLLGKSSWHSVAILATPPGSYFRLTRPGFYLKEWAETQNCTFTGQRDIKTACRPFCKM